jgi:hypothetical protein
MQDFSDGLDLIVELHCKLGKVVMTSSQPTAQSMPRGC